MKKLSLFLLVVISLSAVSCNKFQKEYTGEYYGALTYPNGQEIGNYTLTVKKSGDINAFKFAFEDDGFSKARMSSHGDFSFIQETIHIGGQDIVANGKGSFYSDGVQVTIATDTGVMYYQGLK